MQVRVPFGSPRLTRRLAALAIVTLIAWLIEFSAHLHMDDHALGTAQAAHVCVVCAAFQAGSSSDASTPAVPRAHPVVALTGVPAALPRALLQFRYRSRAPPRA